MSVVLDSSAVLSVLWSELGYELVLDKVDVAVMSAVNYAEVVTKIEDRGIEGKTALALLIGLSIEVVGFDRSQAEAVGALRSQTRRLGLSLGDRACLGLAIQRRLPVLTADKIWAQLELGIDVCVIR